MHKEPEKTDGASEDYSELLEIQPTVALIAPDYGHYRTLKRALESQRANILVDSTIYPSYAHLPQLLAADCDAVIVEIETDADLALELVETICNRKPGTTVMVYSGTHSPESMVRSMRAGAREFLSGNFTSDALQQALVRAAGRRAEQQSKKVSGKLLVFWGAKGGCGVTTIASNFAIALRQETSAEVALVDMNPHLGDVSVLLGLHPRFTLEDALQNGRKLDQELIGTLVTTHSSGISVLAAPDNYTASVEVESRTVGRLADVMRNQYQYVVVDAGRDLGACAEPLFHMADCIYLVTELDVPSLRNAQRILTHLHDSAARNVELVVNRFDPRRSEFDDERVSKTLGANPKWKVPNDYPAVYRSGNTGSPLISEKSPAAGALRSMARAASGRPVSMDKPKRAWSIFG